MDFNGENVRKCSKYKFKKRRYGGNKVVDFYNLAQKYYIQKFCSPRGRKFTDKLISELAYFSIM